MAKKQTQPKKALLQYLYQNPDDNFVNPESVEFEEENGYIEFGEEEDEDGNKETRLTPKALEFLGIETTSQPVKETAMETATLEPITSFAFELENDIPLIKFSKPNAKGRAVRQASYPFDVMAVGQSFFVPAEENTKEAIEAVFKKMTGNCNHYNVKYRQEIPGESRIWKGEVKPKYQQIRRFAMRRVEGGVRIWRVEV